VPSLVVQMWCNLSGTAALERAEVQLAVVRDELEDLHHGRLGTPPRWPHRPPLAAVCNTPGLADTPTAISAGETDAKPESNSKSWRKSWTWPRTADKQRPSPPLDPSPSRSTPAGEKPTKSKAPSSSGTGISNRIPISARSRTGWAAGSRSRGPRSRGRLVTKFALRLCVWDLFLAMSFGPHRVMSATCQRSEHI